MKVQVKKSEIHGKGIFATKDIKKDEVIEVCPIIILNQEDTKIIDNTSLYNYYFGWRNNGSAIVLGYSSIYNHSYQPNARYNRDFINNNVIFIAIKPIRKGEEITVNYNGNPNSQEKVWFEKRH
ncbi:SET domain-containing protein [Candidatus Woesearchaeota archaeon]|nr:SET domain-containing protein [Candidatus Woesearchaeota archaeon]